MHFCSVVVLASLASRARGHGDRWPRNAGPSRRVREGESQPDRGRAPDARHRQPGLPALVGRRRDARSVEDLEPVLGPGVRVRRGVRGREAARLREGTGRLEACPLRAVLSTGRQELRLLHGAGLVHARARDRVVDFSNAYYFVNQALVGREGTAIAECEDASRGPQALPPRRAARYDELPVHRRPHQALLAPARYARTTSRCRR